MKVQKFCSTEDLLKRTLIYSLLQIWLVFSEDSFRFVGRGDKWAFKNRPCLPIISLKILSVLCRYVQGPLVLQSEYESRLDPFRWKLIVLWSPEYIINKFHSTGIFNVNITNRRWEMSALDVCFQLKSLIYDKWIHFNHVCLDFNVCFVDQL